MRPRQTLKKIEAIENDFSPKEFFDGLENLSLEQLVNQYASMNTQFQLMKGLILLAARKQFPSNNAFGEWVNSVHALCVDSQQVRNRYMHLADFFKTRPMTGISLTVAYEISKPDNANVAEEVYDKAFNNNLTVSNVKKLILDMKTPARPSFKNPKPKVDEEKLVQIFNAVKEFNLTPNESIALLNGCILKFKKISDDVIEGEVTTNV